MKWHPFFLFQSQFTKLFFVGKIMMYNCYSVRLFVRTTDFCCHCCPIYIRLYISVYTVSKLKRVKLWYLVFKMLLLLVCRLKSKTIFKSFFILLQLNVLLWAVMYASFYLYVRSFLIILTFPKFIFITAIKKGFCGIYHFTINNC